MTISIRYAPSLHDCEIFCERFLIEAISIWYTNARLKRSFDFSGGVYD